MPRDLASDPIVVERRERQLDLRVGKRSFGWYVVDHPGDGRVALHLKAAPGTSSALAEVHPDRYHVPAYVVEQGWLGLWLDLARVDRAEVAGRLAEARELAAPAPARRARARRARR